MDEELPPYSPTYGKGQSTQGQGRMNYREYRDTQPQMHRGTAVDQFESLWQRKEAGEQLEPEEEKVLAYAQELWEKDRMNPEPGFDVRSRASDPEKMIHPTEDAWLERLYQKGKTQHYATKEDFLARKMTQRPEG